MIKIIAEATPKPTVANIGTIKFECWHKCTSIIGVLLWIHEL